MKLIIPMGKTGTGKDTIARFILDRSFILPIISYTTRPIRNGEVDGREHWFITDEEMNEIVSDQKSLLAYTKNKDTGYQYCASLHGLDPNGTYTYIINPSAYLNMIKTHPDLETVVLFMDLPEYEIKKRTKLRGDKQDAVKKRLDEEREEFDSFKMRHFMENSDDTTDGVDLSKQRLYMISSLNTRDEINRQVMEILHNIKFVK